MSSCYPSTTGKVTPDCCISSNKKSKSAWIHDKETKEKSKIEGWPYGQHRFIRKLSKS
jgi:hypothetical protein